MFREIELAEKLPKRNLILTAAAASITLAVVAVVLAGPSVSACQGSPEGLVACLRQRVVDFGLLPRSGPEAIVTAPQQAPTNPEPPPEPAAVPPAEANAELPALTLLRAEPDGSLVIAGTGRPGTGIVVYADGEPLGVTEAEASGDWAVVPDAPLAPGGVEIAVGEAGSDRLSEQSFVVVIDPDRTSEPLVIASKPGEASSVLQGLPQREAVPLDRPAPVSEPEAVLEPQPETVPSPRPDVAAPPPNAPSAPDLDVAAFAPESEPSTEPPAQTPAPAAPQSTEPPAPDSTPEAGPVDASPADRSIALAEPERAEPEIPAASVPAVIVPLSIDAIEIDGKANFFAGGGTEGATVRLYVDDKFVADAEVAEGRWLVEAASVLTRQSQRVRVDMLKPGTAEVAARAEVNFVVDFPAAGQEPQPAEPAEKAAPPAPPPPIKVAVAPEAVPSAGAESSFGVRVAAEATPTVVEPQISVEIAPEAAASAGVGRSLSPAAPAVLRLPADRDLSVAADAEPSVPPYRDIAAVEEPAPAAPPAGAPEQVAKEPRHTGDKAPDAEIAGVPETAVTAEPRPEPVAPATPAPAAEPRTAVEPEIQPMPAPEAKAEPEPAPEADAQPARQLPAPSRPASSPSLVRPLEPEHETSPESAIAELPAPGATDEFPSVVELAPPEDDVPTLRAVPVGDPDAMRFASGKAIIRRGDNLWSIARRVYGAGLKFTTIYKANKDQIRSPHRIYPGQVFDLPLVYDE